MPAPYGACMRCGFKRRLPDLCKEWTGLRVCKDTCLDPRPAELRSPYLKPEGIILPNASPETEPVFGRTDPEDL
jgi:hypothetical protein